MRKYQYFAIILCSLFFCMYSIAQPPLNQINILSFSVKNKLPADVSTWGNIPGGIILSAQRIPQSAIQGIKLVAQIKQGGAKICGSAIDASPLLDFNAIKTFTGAELSGYISNCNPLKPGSYSICVQFFNLDRYPISKEVCKEFVVEDVVQVQQNYSPPQNISPTNEKVFKPEEVKGVLRFSWSGVTPKKEQVTYRLKVWQLMESQNSMQAMKSNNPVVEKEVTNITQAIVTNLYNGPCKPPYLCDYVWSVQALSREGKSLGTSEFSSFKINSPSAAAACCPGTFTSIQMGHTSTALNTNLLPNMALFPSLPLGANFFINTCYACGAACGTATVVYEYWDMNTGGMIGTSTPGTNCGVTMITVPATLTVGANYLFRIVVYCGGVICDSRKYQFTPTASPTSVCCTGGSWNTLTFNGAAITCGGSLGNININAPININAAYNCPSPSCSGITGISYVVQQGAYSMTYSSAPLAPPTAGPSSLTIYVTCGGVTCQTCSYQFMTTNCCGSWGNTVWGNTSSPPPSTPLPASFSTLGSFNACSMIFFNVNYNCASACGPSVNTYKITTAAFVPISVGSLSGITGITMPSVAGAYILKIYASCGGTICDSLQYNFTVFVNCCLGSTWGPRNVIITPGTSPVLFAGPVSIGMSFLPVIIMHRNTPSIYNVTYNCAACCAAKIKYEFYRPGYSTVDFAPSATNITINTPTATGFYTLKITAYCNGIVCASTVKRIKIIP